MNNRRNDDAKGAWQARKTDLPAPKICNQHKHTGEALHGYKSI